MVRLPPKPTISEMAGKVTSEDGFIKMARVGVAFEYTSLEAAWFTGQAAPD